MSAARPSRQRATALPDHGRREDALARCDRAVKVAPGLGTAHFSRGCALVGLGRSEEALTCFDRVIDLAFARVGSDAGNGCSAPSSERLAKAFAIDRDILGAFYNRGTILLSLKRYDEACASFTQALALDPSYVDALGNRGIARAELGRCDEALADYKEALRIAPNLPDLHVNRGHALLALNRTDEALRCYGKALTLDPEHSDARFSVAVTRLVLGDFRAGWQQYEARWSKRIPVPRPNYPQPVWRGERQIEGKTVLLCAEQGAGDTIQFVRYAPMLAALGAEVVLKVHPSLAALTATVPGVSQIVASHGALPPFDLYCPLLSLPLAFGTELKSIPAPIPYVRPYEDRVIKWRGRLPPDSGRLRVGICWAGIKTHVNDRNRSIPIERFARILSIEGVDFVSLQKEIGATDAAILNAHNVTQPATDFEDFADTAAVIAMLDLVISVDTAVAHLAGAMAKAVGLLVPFSPDWRWLLDRTDSPWYPTMRLFRQSAIGDWDRPIERVRQELADVASRAANARRPIA